VNNEFKIIKSAAVALVEQLSTILLRDSKKLSKNL
jgi:hypothetical protein